MKNVNLTNDRNQLLSSWASVPSVTRSDPDCQWFPALDITRTAEEYLIEVDLPGLNPADI
jgi:HSP20 family molecular chaperone IbpA